MPPRYRETDRQKAMGEARQRLLAAAAEEFARLGYTGANINAISRSAGFAKGTVYNYFPSKRALMLALLDETAAAHVDMMAEAVQDEDDPGQQLVRFFEAGFAFVARHVAQGRTMIHVIYGPDAEFRRHLFDLYRPMFRLLAEDIIRPGIAHGVFHPTDVEATASLLMTIYLGTASQMDEDGRAWLEAGQVADFALRALRARSDPGDHTNGSRQEDDHAT